MIIGFGGTALDYIELGTVCTAKYQTLIEQARNEVLLKYNFSYF